MTVDGWKRMSKSYPVNERGEIGSRMNGKEQKVNGKGPAGFSIRLTQEQYYLSGSLEGENEQRRAVTT